MRREYRYQPLAGDAEADVESREKAHPRSPGGCSLGRLGFAILVMVCWTMLVGATAFVAGQHTVPRAESSVDVPSKLETFRYNRTFGEPPSKHTDEAWESIFPSGGTFFNRPAFSPHRATLSVFHQLHCVDGIRRGYWAIFDAAQTGQPLNETELPMQSRPSHIRHCLDLLRQSLMCHADTTIEVTDEAARGVHGFGVEHQCRDWNALVRQVEEWHAEFDEV